MAISIMGGLGGLTVESDPLSLKLTGGTVTGKVNFSPVGGVAGLNIGIGGTDTASTTHGDLWIAPSGSGLNYRDGLGTWRVLAARNLSNTFTAPQIVSTPAGTTNAALRVTQLGTGNALVVEDSTTPDSTAFVIDQHGKVGIGVAPDTFAALKVDSNGISFDGFVFLPIALEEHNTSMNVTQDLVISLNGGQYRIPLFSV
jgi:hypothetical protein